MLGPLGLDVAPAGEHPFEQLVGLYAQRLGGCGGAVHINCMTTMAECRAAMLAVKEAGAGPFWVSWACDRDGNSPTDVHMLAALFVCEGMGAAAFGLNCREDIALPLLEQLARYADVPLFHVWHGVFTPYPYQPRPHDPDVIPCANSTEPCFVMRTVDVGEELECTPSLLEDIIEAEDHPVGAVKISILEQDDVDIFAQHQYAVRKALCLWSDVPQLLDSALRVYQGRAFYDGTGNLEPEELDQLRKAYGLIVL
ncbi:MAG TPA: hypothetical protein DIT49_05520 [Clostridiales bacterium]|nr:hypothetical protein [Clostridiales bacterium]